MAMNWKMFDMQSGYFKAISINENEKKAIMNLNKLIITDRFSKTANSEKLQNALVSSRYTYVSAGSFNSVTLVTSAHPDIPEKFIIKCSLEKRSGIFSANVIPIIMGRIKFTDQIILFEGPEPPLGLSDIYFNYIVTSSVDLLETETKLLTGTPLYNGDLSAVIKYYSREVLSNALLIIRQIFMGILNMHLYFNTIHGDVKPKNILFDGVSKFLISDFDGVVTDAFNGARKELKYYTPHYVPPEDKKNIKKSLFAYAHTDLYALGIILKDDFSQSGQPALMNLQTNLNYSYRLIGYDIEEFYKCISNLDMHVKHANINMFIYLLFNKLTDGNYYDTTRAELYAEMRGFGVINFDATNRPPKISDYIIKHQIRFKNITGIDAVMDEAPAQADKLKEDASMRTVKQTDGIDASMQEGGLQQTGFQKLLIEYLKLNKNKYWIVTLKNKQMKAAYNNVIRTIDATFNKNLNIPEDELKNHVENERHVKETRLEFITVMPSKF